MSILKPLVLVYDYLLKSLKQTKSLSSCLSLGVVFTHLELSSFLPIAIFHQNLFRCFFHTPVNMKPEECLNGEKSHSLNLKGQNIFRVKYVTKIAEKLMGK